MIELLKKYKSFIAYVVFGVLTTLINIVTYAVCYEHLHIANVTSNILVWTFAVAFAFITNKLWVFGNTNMSLRTILNELWKFITTRLAVGFVDLAIMYIAVDICHGPLPGLRRTLVLNSSFGSVDARHSSATST